MNVVLSHLSLQTKEAYHYFIPKGRLPNEGKIAYFAKEAFILMSKVGVGGSFFYASTVFLKPHHAAIITGIFLTSVLSGCPLRLFTSSTSTMVKMARLALFIETGVLAVWKRDFLWQNRAKLLTSALIGSLSLIAKYFLTINNSQQVLLGENEPLEETKLISDLTQIAQSGKSVKSIELRHKGPLPFILSQKSLELMQGIRPEELKLTHCVLPNQQQKTLDSFNQEMNTDRAANEMNFYYFLRADEVNKHYTLAKVKTSPTQCNLVIEKGCFSLQDFHHRFLIQFHQTRSIHWSANDSYLQIENKNNKKIELNEQLIQEIIHLNPKRIELTKCKLTPQALELLNTVSNKGFFYTSPIHPIHSLYERVELKDAYEIGLGEKLSCESIARRLRSAQSFLSHESEAAPLKTLQITSENEKFALNSSIIDLILSMNAGKIIFKNCIFLSIQFQYLELPYSSSNTTPPSLYRITRKENTFVMQKVLSPEQEFPINLKKGLTHIHQCRALKMQQGINFKKLIIRNYFPEFGFEQELLLALREINPSEIVFTKYKYSQSFKESLATLPNCRVEWTSP